MNEGRSLSKGRVSSYLETLIGPGVDIGSAIESRELSVLSNEATLPPRFKGQLNN